MAQIERIVPWGEWASIIKPRCYEGERGNKPFGLELTPGLHLLHIFMINQVWRQRNGA